jgi:hypothetical protein
MFLKTFHFILLAMVLELRVVPSEHVHEGETHSHSHDGRPHFHTHSDHHEHELSHDHDADRLATLPGLRKVHDDDAIYLDLFPAEATVARSLELERPWLASSLLAAFCKSIDLPPPAEVAEPPPRPCGSGPPLYLRVLKLRI